MRKQTKARCKYCEAKYAKSGMIKHLRGCKERKKEIEGAEKEKKCGYFMITVTGRYAKPYWMVLECQESLTLKELDDFLRDIWLECCGHLSCFRIYERNFFQETFEDDYWEEEDRDMSFPLKTVLEEGTEFTHIYDFGDTTELILTVIESYEAPKKKEKITIAARNESPEILCTECGENFAKWICTSCLYSGELSWICEECEQDHSCDQEMFLPVVNSPRCGICAYSGSEIYGD